MGYRVHVVKQTEQYADIEAFNWNTSEFKGLLNDLGCNVIGDYDRFECSKDDFKQAIGLVKCYVENGTTIVDGKKLASYGVDTDRVNDCEYDIELVDSCLRTSDETIGCTPQELLSTMETFLEQSDQECDYIIFVCY